MADEPPWAFSSNYTPKQQSTEETHSTARVRHNLNIAHDEPALADCATLGAHGVRPHRVRLDIGGAAALALSGRHFALQSQLVSSQRVCKGYQC